MHIIISNYSVLSLSASQGEVNNECGAPSQGTVALLSWGEDHALVVDENCNC